ncbi:hypothetical protein L1887_53908 [Cichorium endivia]|nr:hypothetical protein L1887_53908 [Cichorium endivia]
MPRNRILPIRVDENDVSIANLLTILRVILKLHQLPGKANLSWDEQHGIRVLYFNETLSPIESEPYVLRIPICLEADFCTEFVAKLPPEIKAIGKNISFDIHVIFDDLVMREQEGLEQPEWLTDELQEEIKKLGKISFDGFLGTQKLQKLNAVARRSRSETRRTPDRRNATKSDFEANATAFRSLCFYHMFRWQQSPVFRHHEKIAVSKQFLLSLSLSHQQKRIEQYQSSWPRKALCLLIKFHEASMKGVVEKVS